MPPAQHAPQAGGLTQGGRGAQTQRAEGVVEAAAAALQRRCAATLAEILRVEIDVRQAGEGFEREGAQLQLALVICALQSRLLISESSDLNPQKQFEACMSTAALRLLQSAMCSM